ncbi:hypothetical protein AAWM_04415 [Aspergillus awamori]|uniref:Uncharacterized protein n=2 Tax=Aspergillus TaxID=5052 RepID=A0A3F3PN35_9EURO|nr:hypothetical protein BDQ94DRAFT_152169 [Aspergillus welwitschiae]KAI2857324.1 hypothetical protein CBS12448_6549 [Aspergillus niger]GCB21530.1 hypothetical protein AAWM_04415 [Aspergillus awamori]KAI2925421.1 hypothetical protein CBS147320_6284 [Aspergillus niger]KAI2956251.1 hypothetical protein CBS147322_2715 [Aspergillus niger]KAI2989567.1 hypothetical protein CBS147344_3087 [Aspergillus niger]
MRLLSVRRCVGQLTDYGCSSEDIPGVRYMTIDLKFPRRTIQAHNRRLIEVTAKMAKPASLSGFGFGSIDPFLQVESVSKYPPHWTGMLGTLPTDGGVVLLIKLFPTLMDIARVIWMSFCLLEARLALFAQLML